MGGMDGSVLWRAALLQALTLGLVALALGALLDKEFFGSWGWLAGPGAWAACALFTGAVLRLPRRPVLAGAALAGLPSLIERARRRALARRAVRGRALRLLVRAARRAPAPEAGGA